MRRELGMLVALVVICLALAWSNSAFIGQANMVNTSRQISMLGVYAIGLAFVIITGGIDLSVGSVIGLTGVIIAKISAPDPGFDKPLWMGISVAMAVALSVGLIQGLLIAYVKLQSFIVTLGFMLLLRGVSETIANGTITITDARFLALANEGILYVRGFPIITWPVIVFLIVALIATYLLHFTVFGRYVYAIGGNRDAAEYSGIPVKRVEVVTYVISSGLGGLAGVLFASYIASMSEAVGQAYELIAIAAAVLGGCSLRGGEGTILGVIIGSAVMRVIENGINMFKIRDWRPNEHWRYIIIGAVILVAVILDQVFHIVQAARRTRKAGAAAAGAPAAGFEVRPPANAG